jgi:hypothetical protein
MESLANGALTFHKPGIFMSFEETTGELANKMKSFEFDFAT